MITILLGTKCSQSQQFDPDGKRLPVTTITAGPCWVTRIIDAPLYRSIQLGFGNSRKITKPLKGHIKKSGLEEKLRFFREVRISGIPESLKLGQKIVIKDVFQEGDNVRVTGISKGKGFAGVVKRHGFAGGPRTHGQSDRERAPGSIGSTTTPGRVLKGKRMAGRMGSEKITQRGLKIVSIDAAMNSIKVKGLVPGPINGLVIIEKEKAKSNKKEGNDGVVQK